MSIGVKINNAYPNQNSNGGEGNTIHHTKDLSAKQRVPGLKRGKRQLSERLASSCGPTLLQVTSDHSMAFRIPRVQDPSSRIALEANPSNRSMDISGNTKTSQMECSKASRPEVSRIMPEAASG
ncbi:hypothetical protein BofuT4_P075830.1 [Botrytis cinerea T4]|uniref:Uncharacterized protein n=1 Tax=Botryotinia fuckeliana (strain T4) TaxID=999810 RepID=G2XNP4_BOTF4|nr:hypothetical protein BofuT4_P075830.1 [Botrytis cinerea T4]